MQNFTKSSLPLFILLLLFFITNAVQAQSAVDRIYTDWGGYWTANAATGSDNRPDSENNLTAFQWNGKTYSTGVNDSRLITEKVAFDAHKFRALKIQDIKRGNSTFFLQGAMIDETKSASILTPALTGAVATSAEMVARLTDGINGLALGTGIANIGTSSVSFKIGTDNLNLNGLNDGIPDLIVTQVALPGGADVFKFVDALGKTVGDPVTIAFQGVKVVGSYSLDIFDSTDGKPANGFISNEVRDIRILAYDLSAFGITAALAPTVDRFVVTFSGSSDCAFIAFNANSLKLAQLDLVKKASLVSCGKLGDKITYDFEVTNTGDVPLRNITVVDPKLGTTAVGTISTLNVGAKVTFTANYTITAADVALGYVSNSAKVTAIDPSDNLVEDISGQTINNDVATVINLLTPPTIGAITAVTCSIPGSVQLSNLPASGTWSVERLPGNVIVNGTGDTKQISNLPAGKYSFRVTNETGCKSPASAEFVVPETVTNKWNGTKWSDGTPNITQNLNIEADLSITAATNLTGCNCTVQSGYTVTVNGDATLTLQDKLTNNGTVIFENNASLVQINNAINSGKVTYKRTTTPVRRFDFTYWSSPVSNFKLSDLSPNTLSDKYLAYNNAWAINYNGTAVMQAAAGYAVRAPQSYNLNEAAPFSASFEGVPNNGDIPYAIKGTWNLIGNPYPSAVYADEFIYNNTNLYGTLYFWTHNSSPDVAIVGNATYNYTSGDYASYNITGGIGKNRGTAAATGSPEPLGYIAAGQSFFVAAQQTVGTVLFTNEMRVAGRNKQFYKMAKTTSMEKNRIWLNLTNEDGLFKQILIGYVSGATNGYDAIYDGVTYNGNSFADFYSINDGSRLAIQGRAVPFTAEEIPLGFSVKLTKKPAVESSFSIGIDHTDGNLNEQPVFLYDNQTSKTHNLRKGNYTFSSADGVFDDRFILKYGTTLGVDDFNTENKVLEVYVNNKKITIDAKLERINKVTIFDITGKSIYTKENINNTVLEIENLKISNQVLIVQTILENGATSNTKIIL
ncbi:DUF7507 domain-containing protein [Flavobacterium sp. TMP13]|uniref:DUF7507 domain-containing protein n=1 Tax=Flavobacterium sp. TMP13 TaxID=3425950 RepID=UPI003D77754C